MQTLEQAASRAKSFLASVGVPTIFAVLDSAQKQGDQWVICYRYSTSYGPDRVYTVTLKADSGEVVGYDKGTE